MFDGGVVARDALDHRQRGDDRRHRASAVHHLRTHEVVPVGHAIQVGVHAEGLLDEIAGGQIEDADLAHYLVVFAAQGDVDLQSLRALVRCRIESAPAGS